MNAILFIEGGPDRANNPSGCREAFKKLLINMDLGGRLPRLVACGARHEAFTRFKTALSTRDANFVGLWLDSEDPLGDIDDAWAHLGRPDRDGWMKPEGATDDHVLFMTTCMETWIVADRAALREHYVKHLNENALPPLQDLEGRHRHAVLAALEKATQNCSNPYCKGKRSFAAFACLNPKALEALPSFARVQRILRANL